MQEQKTHYRQRNEPRRMEIWFAKLGQKDGTSIQGGDRPVLILSNDVSNAVSSVVTVLPMTSKPKRMDLPSHSWVEADEFEGLRTGALVLAEQITTISREQLVFRIAVCKDESTMRRIEASVQDQLGIGGKEKNMNANYPMSPAKTKQEFLNDLPDWDGVKRVDTMLIDYLGARDSAYVRELSRNMMISAVARALNEEPIDAITPMLIGPPGCGKSAFIEKLGSGYSETVTGSLSGKTARMLSGNLLVEVCEVDRSVVEMLHRTEPFLGVITTNHLPQGFLVRRVMPVHVGINDSGRAFTAERDEIDQLWAEALAAFKDGEKPYVGGRDTDGFHVEETPIKKKHPYGID